MRKRRVLSSSLGLFCLLLLGVFSASGSFTAMQNEDSAYRAVAGPKLAQGRAHRMTVGLAFDSMLSERFTQASGQIELDLIAGRVVVDIVGLPDGDYDVWILDRQPEPYSSVRPHPGDARLNLGRLERDGEHSRLLRELGPRALARFNVDLVAVAAADRGPEQGLLYGSPRRFQRLYTDFETRAQVVLFRMPLDAHS